MGYRRSAVFDFVAKRNDNAHHTESCSGALRTGNRSPCWGFVSIERGFTMPSLLAATDDPGRRKLLKFAAVMASASPLSIARAQPVATPTLGRPEPNGQRQLGGGIGKGLIGYMLAHEQFPVRELVELGSQAAQGGFHLLATSDHFQPWQANEGHSGEAWVTLGALSSRVSRSWMGTTAMAPADDLSGTISATPDIGFTSALSNSFVNLAPTQINDFLSLAPITTTPGTHTKVVTLAA